MGRGVIWIDFQGLLKMRDRLVRTAGLQEASPRSVWALAKSGLMSMAFW
jgi:GH43 family beta-xylosidase